MTENALNNAFEPPVVDTSNKGKTPLNMTDTVQLPSLVLVQKIEPLYEE